MYKRVVGVAVAIIAVLIVVAFVLMMAAPGASTKFDSHYDQSVPASERIGSLEASVSVTGFLVWPDYYGGPTSVSYELGLPSAKYTHKPGVSPSTPAAPINTSYVPDDRVLLTINITLERPGMAILYDVQDIIVLKMGYYGTIHATAPFLISETGAYTLTAYVIKDGKVVDTSTSSCIVPVTN